MSTEQESTTVNLQTGASNPEENANSLKYMFLKRHMQYDPISIAFAILIFIGGIIGYFNKGSTISLVASTIFFFLLAVSTYIEGTRKNPWPLMVSYLALGSMMFYRFATTGKFMHSGLIALLAFIMLARHGYLTYLRNRQETIA